MDIKNDEKDAERHCLTVISLTAVNSNSAKNRWNKRPKFWRFFPYYKVVARKTINMSIQYTQFFRTTKILTVEVDNEKCHIYGIVRNKNIISIPRKTKVVNKISSGKRRPDSRSVEADRLFFPLRRGLNYNRELRNQSIFPYLPDALQCMQRSKNNRH